MQLLPQNLKSIQVTNDIGDPVNHVLEDKEINAVNAALTVNRPLLIWGEPGIGKSQLARAVASKLQRPFFHFVTDARTESRDLLWQFDAVKRLADAQIRSTQHAEPPDQNDEKNQNKTTDDYLAIENYIVPGKLWWALNWQSAQSVAEKSGHAVPETQGYDHNNGVVLLIDEIDKADSDVPNGLLEALGSSRFQPQGMDQPVACNAKVKPLVMITTNEERSLPDAFLRRCLSLHLQFPEQIDKQHTYLIERAQQNSSFYPLLSQEIFEQAAKMLVDDRQQAKNNYLYPLPGQAEFFDLLRGLQNHSQASSTSADELIELLRPFIFQKHAGFHSNTQ